MPKIVAPLVSVYGFRLTARGPEYLLLRRRAGLDHLGGTWQAIHGGIEPGETAVQAARREAREETGLEPVSLWALDYVEVHYQPHQDALRVVPCFAAQFPADTQPRLGPEHEAYAWLALEGALRRVLWRGQREALRTLHRTIARPLLEGREPNPLLKL